jgi:hypothetical protein
MLLAAENRLEGSAHVLTGDGKIVSPTCIIQLPAIHQSLPTAKYIEVGRARGSVGLGNLLACVKAERKHEPQFLCHRSQARRCVVGIGLGIV